MTNIVSTTKSAQPEFRMRRIFSSLWSVVAVIVVLGSGSCVSSKAIEAGTPAGDEATASSEELDQGESPAGEDGAPAQASTVQAIPSQDADVGIPYSLLFRESGAPIFGTTSMLIPGRGLLGELNGENFSGRFHVSGLGSIQMQPDRFILDRAHLKLGPVFLHVDSLTGTLLYRDRDSGDHRSSEWHSVIDFRFSLAAQFGESSTIALGADIFYWPFDNRVQLFSRDAIFFQQGNNLSAQMAYEAKIGGWKLTLSDDLRSVVSGYLGSGRTDLFLLDLSQSEDTSGNYYRFGARNDRNLQDFVVLTNSVSARTHGEMVSNQLLFTGSVFHEDLWYFPTQDGLPASRDGLTVRIESLFDNFRFKPFISYTVMGNEFSGSFYQEIRTGVTGPITDQLSLLADAGYAWGGMTTATAVGGVRLNHLAGPNTTEALFIRRQISDFGDAIVDSGGYNITQILGPSLLGRIFAEGERYQSDLNVAGGKQALAGASLRYMPSEHLRANLVGYYNRTEGSFQANRTEGFAGLTSLAYSLGNGLTIEAVYRVRFNRSLTGGNDSVDHAASLSIRKFFR